LAQACACICTLGRLHELSSCAERRRQEMAPKRRQVAACLLLAAFLEGPRHVGSVGQPPSKHDATVRRHQGPIGVSELQKTSFGSGSDEPQSYEVTMLREIPHRDAPWTQGLEFGSDGRLVETSGNYPNGIGSFVRILDVATGEPTRKITEGMEGSRFIEGIAQQGDGHWFASTYTDKVAVEYDKDFKVVKEHRYPWTGWGLTRGGDGSSFLATNGTEYVMRLDRESFVTTDVKVATCLGKRVEGLNELEMVDDFLGQGPALLGNVINTRVVLVLDPSTARCTGVFSLAGPGLEAERDNEKYGYHVANGIAYDREKGTFIVTGKNWESMFEVRVTRPESPARGPALAMLQRHLSDAASVF